MAFAAVGALFSGIAAGTAVAATTALMAVSTIGAVMSVAGAVTGNKGLMKVGAVMGLVGGVGGLVAGATAGAAGAVAGEVVGESAAGSVFNAATDATSMGAINGMDAMSDAFVASGSSGAGGFSGLAAAADDAISALGYTNEMDKISDLASSSSSSSSNYINQLDAASDAFSGGKTPNAGGLSSGDTLKSLTTDAKVSDINPLDKYAGSSSNPNAANYVNQMDAADAATTTSKDYFKGILEWVKQNDKLANNIMTVGAGALKGVSERSMFDEKMALEKSRYQYGNTVAKPYSAQPLIGAR